MLLPLLSSHYILPFFIIILYFAIFYHILYFASSTSVWTAPVSTTWTPRQQMWPTLPCSPLLQYEGRQLTWQEIRAEKEQVFVSSVKCEYLFEVGQLRRTRDRSSSASQEYKNWWRRLTIFLRTEALPIITREGSQRTRFVLEKAPSTLQPQEESLIGFSTTWRGEERPNDWSVSKEEGSKYVFGVLQTTYSFKIR